MGSSLWARAKRELSWAKHNNPSLVFFWSGTILNGEKEFLKQRSGRSFGRDLNIGGMLGWFSAFYPLIPELDRGYCASRISVENAEFLRSFKVKGKAKNLTKLRK